MAPFFPNVAPVNQSSSPFPNPSHHSQLASLHQSKPSLGLYRTFSNLSQISTCDDASSVSSSCSPRQNHENSLHPTSQLWADMNDDGLQQNGISVGNTVHVSRASVKNTFLHFDVEKSVQMRRSSSCPAVVMESEFVTKFPKMEILHNRGECKPCAYYLYKTDGCRWGSSCSFCHLCTVGELKRRKQQKLKAIKEKAQARTKRNGAKLPVA